MTILLVVPALCLLTLAVFGIAKWRDSSNRHMPGHVLAMLLSALIRLVRIAVRILVFLIGLATPVITGMLDWPRMPNARGRLRMDSGMRVCQSCRGRGARTCGDCRGKGCASSAGGGAESCAQCRGMDAVNA